MDNIDDQVDLLNSQADSIIGRYTGIRDYLNHLDSQSKQAEDTLASLAMVKTLFQKLAETINYRNETLLAELATLALGDVFYDLQLKLKTEHSVFRGQPSTKILLVDAEQGAEGDPMDSFGGGPSALLGVILQVVSVVRQKGFKRILILDEAMAHVSEKYQASVGRLLRKICSPTNQGGLQFDILFVTHNPIYVSSAHRAYDAKWVNRSLTIEEKNGTDLT